MCCTWYLCSPIYSHSLRFSTFNPVVVPCFRKVCNGIRFFSYAPPILWNHLPNNIRSAHSYISFRKKLKTYLFNQAFPTWIASPLSILTLLASNCNLFSDYSIGQISFEPWFTREVSNL